MIATIFAGDVDAIDGEWIHTKFLFIGPVPIPLSSHYVVEEAVEEYGIALHGRSVVLGYLQVLVSVGVIVMLVFACCSLGDQLSKGVYIAAMMIGVVVAPVAAVLVLTLLLGRPSAFEKIRRLLLKRRTGRGAPPEFLPSDVRAETTERLMEAWQQAHPGETWTVSRVVESADPLNFALAEYHGHREVARRALYSMIRGRDTEVVPLLAQISARAARRLESSSG